MLDKQGEEDAPPVKKSSLLIKFDIPVAHLDFAYVRKCNHIEELEKILKILRSGEEGYFPELMSCTEQRLADLDPLNRHLRVGIPVIRTQHLNNEHRQLIIQDISEWVETIEKLSSPPEGKKTPSAKQIWLQHSTTTPGQVPIRGQPREPEDTTSQSVILTTPTPSTTTCRRIKSCDYDKWAKFDVDEELTRMDVVEMQTAEWEKVLKPKLQVKQNQVEKLMKNLDTLDPNDMDKKMSKTTKVDVKGSPPLPIQGTLSSSREKCLVDMSFSSPSFIEELEDHPDSNKDNKGKAAQNPKPHRRVRIQIEDVYVGF